MVEQLKTTGMTQSKARELLRTWADLGAKDPEQVRKLLVNRSLQPVTGLAIQSALDVCAALFGFYTGTVAGQVDFPGQLLVQLAAYFFGCYYFIQAAAEAGALVAVVVTARKYSTDSDVMLAAIQELAGPMSGLSVIDKAQLAVNTLKIIQTLESIAESLKDYNGTLEKSTLANLSAYLTLQRAEDKYGFQPSKYGLSEAQAADVAGVFSAFDRNDDGRLELSELKTLCNSLGKELSEPELKEAIKLLDSSGTGFVSFSDFVDWYTGGKPDQTAKEAAAAQRN
eukprot:jgi/Chrzof1/12990/Cz07g15150.t1